jgi:hypothetical protein
MSTILRVAVGAHAEITGLAARIGHDAPARPSDDAYSPAQKVEEVSAAYEAETAYARRTAARERCALSAG